MALTLQNASCIEDLIPITSCVELSRTNIRHSNLAVRPLDKNHIVRLSKLPASLLPPIELAKFLDNGKTLYLIVDGTHRYHAALLRKDSGIRGIARTYENIDAVLQACFTANFKHGMQASAKTRTAYARWLHITHPSLKITEIANIAGINKSVVSRALATDKNKSASSTEGSIKTFCNAIIKTVDKLPDINTGKYDDDVAELSIILDEYIEAATKEQKENIMLSMTLLCDVIHASDYYIN